MEVLGIIGIIVLILLGLLGFSLFGWVLKGLEVVWDFLFEGCSTSYDFSGGQIENITRKATVNAILHGDASNDLARLTEYCKAERLDNTGRRKVGF